MTPALWAASVLSGLAALVYQVLWSRELSLVLGTSTEAVSVVLSSFMAGLGLGNALAARVLGRQGSSRVAAERLARAYAVLEAWSRRVGSCFPSPSPDATGGSRRSMPTARRPLTFRLARAGLAFALLAAPPRPWAPPCPC